MGPPISSAGRNDRGPTADRGDARAGYVLIDLVATLAVMGLIALIAYPAMPTGTTSTGMTALLVATESVMRDARTMAIASGKPAFATVDRTRRTIRSGEHVVELPADIELTVTAGESCKTDGQTIAIGFRPDGTSCGGIVRLAKGKKAFRVRVNWVTGHVAIVDGG